MAHGKLPFDEHERLDSEERLRRQPVEPLVELVAAGSPELVVDWGSGTGTFAVPLAKRLVGGTVVCVDVEPRMLEVLRSRAAAAGVSGRMTITVVDPGEPLPLPTASSDRVLMVNLYHELDDRPAALREALRILRPGGRVLVCDWDPEGDPGHGPAAGHRIPAIVAGAELEAAGFALRDIGRIYQDFWVIEGELRP